MRKKNYKKGQIAYRRTMTLADKKKRSNQSLSSLRSNTLFMRHLLHEMPAKRRREIFILFGVCVFFMALVKSLPEIFTDELDMEKRMI